MTNIQRLRAIGRVAIMAVVAITPALAVTVTYNTVGTFDCSGLGSGCTTSNGGSTLNAGNGLSIAYGDLTGATVNTPGGSPTTAQFGKFTAAGGSPTSGDTLSAGFNLSVTQTVPTPTGTALLTDQFAGTIFSNSSTIVLTFTGGSGSTPPPSLTSDPLTFAPAYTFSFGGVTYWVDQHTPINPSTTGNGISTINGAIEASAVPEPAFYGLTGTGFAGLLAMALRRRRQQIRS